MNKNRALYLLFHPQVGGSAWLWNKCNSEALKTAGYTLVYCHQFPNDEPPYVQVSYWGIGEYIADVYNDDYELLHYYLIRTQDAEVFVAYMNQTQKDYCDLMIEGSYTRAAGEHNLSMKEYADGAIQGMHTGRRPKVKYIYQLPHILSQLS